MAQQKKAVLFDMDGVLLDSEKLHMEAAKRVLKPYGIEIPENLRLEFMGLSEREYWERLKEKFQSLPSPEILAQKKNRAFWKVIREKDYSAFPGAREILKWLKAQKILLAVVSSTPTPQVKYILRKIGLFPFFDLLVGGEKIKEGKPSPEIYLYTARKLNLSPSDCIVIEDSKNGITAGLRAGMSVIAMRPPPNAKGIVPKEVYEFDELREILKPLIES